VKEKVTLQITLILTKSAFCFGVGVCVWSLVLSLSLNFGGCVVLWVGKKSKGVNNTRGKSRMGGHVKCTHT
jgi:hypothetical protein